MPNIIVTSRFIRNPAASSVGKLVRYMGTREGVEKLPVSEANLPATKKQEGLIQTLLRQAPNSAEYPEYADYPEQKTRAAASDFIDAWVERNADKADGIKKLVNYMAERPGVQRLGPHGLFSQSDEPIRLQEVAEQVSQHPGVVWTHVVSLHREDAERLGYQNAEAWKQLVRRNVAALAEAHKIDVSNLRWYAAFHDTTHHPHMHLLVYAADAKQGYLTNKGIESLRKTFGQDIFRNEMYHLFTMETKLRNELKRSSSQTLREYMAKSQQLVPASDEMQTLFQKLLHQLNDYHGKKVYGYLPPAIKATVNQITRELAKDERVAGFYAEWNRINHQKLSLYYEKDKSPVPLEDNKEFRSIKNDILRAAGQLQQYSGQSADVKSIKISSAVCGLVQILGQMLQSRCDQKMGQLRQQVDHKIASQISEKKLAHGIRVEPRAQAMDADEQQMQGMSL